MTSLRRPRALRRGDRVAVLCVSSPVTSTSALEAGLDTLRFAGLDPVLYPSVREQGGTHHYLAGDDKLRAHELTAALTDQDIAGIIFAKGGYGAQRTLEVMDWDALADAEPKVLAGFSDVTAILEAVSVRLGWASLFAPTAGFGGDAPHYSFASLIRTLMHPAAATQLRFPDAVTITDGTARGVTMGGTLALLTSSLGSNTSRTTARGGILLLEDVHEEDYRIDRMLTQLRRSGYLDGVSGIVAGTFTDCGPAAQVEAVLTERLADLNVPMIAWANVGHGGRFQTFPIGIAAELDATARTLTLDDPPLTEPGA